MSRKHQRHYYFDAETRTSVWDCPADYTSDGEGSGGDAAGETIRASHLLVKHTGSRRPSSWREVTVTRTKEDALKRLRGFETQIRSGQATLAELAASESDCSSAKAQGDLGFFGRGKMQPPFEEAAFALGVGEMSGPVETQSGVHLILRTA
ncbi:hypothetical protein CXG81DRAFT_23485 [Caulochytrium protostelioides]|uniref:Peptidyl-prolyl cis-trans isomerase n=1 Tax=Caulochytrium protostelioides TaxID=1555241 RepID=A0A4P9XEI4_9FUNG|nr:hypothetical protein CXG81DRAFT_23485 [Caulochytrium protostelioides]|eukprot:RKP03928.1 hypothetical protein CXG81DRAFT_23485 [Caulochytrium protostelioides]